MRLFITIIVTSVVFLFCLFFGPSIIVPFSASDLEREIILSIRLPRVITAFLMGSALGASGAVLQGMLRNPLADPYILGLSGGASLLAAGGMMIDSTLLGALTTPVLAFFGALGAGVLVGIMGWKRGGLMPERLLLAGIGMGFLFSAVLMLLMSVSTNEGLRRATLWLFGDLAMADWSLIPVGAIFIMIGFGISLWRGKALNSLMLGDELSHSLGFSPKKEVTILFISVGLMSASSVSLGGMVGFIGLLVPHIMRAIIGADNRILIPASALGGGMLLMVSDLIGRVVFKPVEIPSGIITALLGAPYFLYLLRRRDVVS